ncbi:MAG: hypothetical protein AUJ75_00090 [Candidatus Omnitrophica bacterium CG1_02_49_10]|nr:MAG: hypothetical protein AUJ75_00090 [Candidatus Omnitrophica bacterium CG1_02_49_10]
MTAVDAVIAGILQGITEFFPISSSGHLVLLNHIFGFAEPQMAFDIQLHLGTLLAIAVFFRRDIASLFTSRRGLLLAIAVGTIPALIAGVAFKKYLESFFAGGRATGYGFIITALWLLAGQFYGDRFGVKRPPAGGGVDTRKAIIIGLAQAVALVPGISRSGATISTGLMCGADREASFRFSFLLAIPVILAASAFEAFTSRNGMAFTAVSVSGILAAFAAGLITLKILSGIVKTGRLYYFGAYCLIAGIIALVIL